jgi:hypothetical protein
VRYLPVWGLLLLLLLLVAVQWAPTLQLDTPIEASVSPAPPPDARIPGVSARTARAEPLESDKLDSAQASAEHLRDEPLAVEPVPDCAFPRSCPEEVAAENSLLEPDVFVWAPVVLRNVDAEDPPFEEPKPTPTPQPEPDNNPFRGEIVETFSNCGLTQLFGVVHDGDGTPLPGVRVQVTWRAPDAEIYTTIAGDYVRPETDESGWDIFLNSMPVANAWYVAVVDEGGDLLSREVRIDTANSCNEGDVNIAKIRFYTVPENLSADN